MGVCAVVTRAFNLSIKNGTQQTVGHSDEKISMQALLCVLRSAQ